MLIHFGVIPYLVFDGDYLPSKAATEIERAKRREESKKKGLELYRLNKPSQAHLELQKAVDVTPEMALQLIEELKKLGIQYIVAPYEADAQLAYLERQGIIQGILSEDSDLLVFGAKRLLTKLDQYGDCIEINRADFTSCREISLVGWSDADFRCMAILSGCDYLASINRMGLKSAYRIVRKHKKIEKILRMLSFDGQYHVPPGYLEAFRKAELTFLHQRVFCPLKKNIVMMTDLQADAEPEDFSFIGGSIEQNIAIGIAKGDLDPITKKPIHVIQTVKTAPRTPWSNPRRNSANPCSDSKAIKPMDLFFKPNRTPLAELDPNSFTPSPTQERLLRHANGSTWEPSSVPAGPPSSSSRQSVSLPSSIPRSALSNISSDAANGLGAALTRPTPSKRRRLCTDSSDITNAGTSIKSELGRSRFFEANASDTCPSIKGSKKSRKEKNTDITIWSDESIEDAMAELPDVTDFSQSESNVKMRIFKDVIEEKVEGAPCQGNQDSKPSKDESQSAKTSRGTADPDLASNKFATSFTSSTPSVAATLDKHVTNELKILAQQYTYRPETERTISQVKETRSSKEPSTCVNASLATTKSPLRRQQSMTPLQRLGLGAIHRSKSCSGFLNSTVDGAGKISENASMRDSPPVSRSIPCLPLAYSIGPDASTSKGSEDAIIPDSEDEGAASPVEERAKPRLDLGRFAFMG